MIEPRFGSGHSCCRCQAAAPAVLLRGVWRQRVLVMCVPCGRRWAKHRLFVDFTLLVAATMLQIQWVLLTWVPLTEAGNLAWALAMPLCAWRLRWSLEDFRRTVQTVRQLAGLEPPNAP